MRYCDIQLNFVLLFHPSKVKKCRRPYDRKSMVQGCRAIVYPRTIWAMDSLPRARFERALSALQPCRQNALTARSPCHSNVVSFYGMSLYMSYHVKVL